MYLLELTMILLPVILLVVLQETKSPRQPIELLSYANRTKVKPLDERRFIYYLLSDALAELLAKLTRYFRSRSIHASTSNTHQPELFDFI